MIEKAITLDFARRTSPVVVFAKQGDKDSRYITITPLNNGVPYDIPEGVSVKFACRKPDGHQVFNDYPSIVNGKITVVLTEQTLAAAGEASASVILFDDVNGRILSSQNFVLLVEENPLMNADLESSDEYQTFMSALATIDEILEAAENGSLGGTTWFFGEEVPGTLRVDGVEGAKTGDIYLNTSTNAVYKARTVDWIKIADLGGAGGGSGEQGEPGRGVSSATINSSGQLVLSYTDGTTETVGKVVGDKGDPGYTPVKGTDYFTEADKAELVASVSSVSVAKNQGSANVGKILVVGTDGNLTLADMPEGGASGDVIGTLDDSNNILLSGNLADGTYTLKYENADGTYTDVGTLEVGSIIEPVTVDIALTDGIRIGSDGADRTLAGYCATEMIDLRSIPKPCTINLTKAQWCSDGTSSSVRYYVADASGTNLYADVTTIGTTNYFTVTANETWNDVTVTVTSTAVGYIRFSGYWANPNYSDSNSSFTSANTKATLTYTPVS